MKKIWLKLIAIVLCVLMLAPTLVACGDQNTDSTSDTTEDTTTTDTKTEDSTSDTTKGEDTTKEDDPPLNLPTDIVMIEVLPENAFCETGFLSASALVDEYGTLGDPALGKGQSPSSTPNKPSGWANEKGLSVSIDLGATHYVSSIYYYNYNKEVDMSFATKLDRLDDWSEEIGTTTPALSKWVEIKIDAECRYIHLSSELASNAPGEIVFYGYRTGAYDEVPEKTEHAYPTFAELMGMNGNINLSSKTSAMSAAAYLREYHSWLWTEYREGWGLGTPTASYTATNVGNFDTFYYLCNKKGLSVVPCMMYNTDLDIFIDGQSKPSMPLEDGTYDTDNPATYYTYASAIYQYAARYGFNDFTDSETGEQDLSTIRVLVGGKKVGLGYIKYIELGNEPDVTWEQAEDHHTPFELAALTSAGYDGHEGTMGVGYGAKNADPNIKVAVAGIAGGTLDYIRAMELWAKYNRQDGKLPFDVVNVHSYCVKTVTVNGNSVNMGCSPEEAGLVKRLQKFVDWRDTYYPDMEVWLSEFGWDTNQSYQTKTSSHAYGEYTGREVQAMWIVRTYILLSASGVDKAFMYMCQGANDDSVGQYGTCGLLDGNGQKKDSWYYMNTLLATMGDMSFQEEIESGHKNVMVYRYQNAEGKSGYILWCPTSDGTKVDGYELHLSGAKTAELVEFENLMDTGAHSNLTVGSDGKVTVNVSECPIIILAE